MKYVFQISIIASCGHPGQIARFSQGHSSVGVVYPSDIYVCRMIATNIERVLREIIGKEL